MRSIVSLGYCDQPTESSQTFFVDAAMLAEIGSRRFGALDFTIIKDLRTMLESCNSYVQYSPSSLSTNSCHSRSVWAAGWPSTHCRAPRPLQCTGEQREDRQTHRSGLAVTFITLVTLILFWLIDWLIAGTARRSVVVQPRPVEEERAAGLQMIPEAHRI